MEFVYIILGMIIGSGVGILIFCLVSGSGMLRIDHSNPAKDIYRVEIEDLDILSKKKRVILKVDNHADLSQK
jgi:hypothetical protein